MAFWQDGADYPYQDMTEEERKRQLAMLSEDESGRGTLTPDQLAFDYRNGGGDWMDRLGQSVKDVGAGMLKSEAADFSGPKPNEMMALKQNPFGGGGSSYAGQAAPMLGATNPVQPASYAQNTMYGFNPQQQSAIRSQEIQPVAFNPALPMASQLPSVQQQPQVQQAYNQAAGLQQPAVSQAQPAVPGAVAPQAQIQAQGQTQPAVPGAVAPQAQIQAQGQTQPVSNAVSPMIAGGSTVSDAYATPTEQAVKQLATNNTQEQPTGESYADNVLANPSATKADLLKGYFETNDPLKKAKFMESAINYHQAERDIPTATDVWQKWARNELSAKEARKLLSAYSNTEPTAGDKFSAFLRAVGYNMMGLPQLAVREFGRVGIGTKDVNVDMGDGTRGIVSVDGNGDIASGMIQDKTGRIREMNSSELEAAQLMAGNSKNIGHASATRIRDASGKEWSVVPTTRGSIFYDNNGVRGVPKGQTTPVTTGSDLRLYAQKALMDIQKRGAGSYASVISEFNALRGTDLPLTSAGMQQLQIIANGGEVSNTMPTSSYTQPTASSTDEARNTAIANIPGLKENITSTTRTRAEQQALYDRYKAGDKTIFIPNNPADFPGRETFHEGSMDINKAFGDKNEAALNAQGWYRPNPKNDPVHWEYKGQVTGGKSEAPAGGSKTTNVTDKLLTPPTFRDAGHEGETPAQFTARTKQWEESTKDVAKKQAKSIQNAQETNDVFRQIYSLLPGSTGSGIGAKVDSLSGYFGISTKGAEAIAAIEPLANKILMSVPRFEGPQSDKDTAVYHSAAGDLANPSKPVAQRIAALKTIIALNKKYAPELDWDFKDNSKNEIKIIKREKIK